MTLPFQGGNMGSNPVPDIFCYFGVIAGAADLRSASNNGVWVRVPEVVFESIILSFDLFGYAFCL